jgi:hypothetical protein
MGRSSNDDRSDRYNPNNDAYWAAEANEAEQRGEGEDDVDDEPSSPQPASSLSHAPSPIALHFHDFDDEHQEDSPLVRKSPSSEGHRAGWRILDRTSHVLLALAHSLRIVESYRIEREPRASERRAWRESIEHALEACRERERAAAPYFEPFEAARDRVDEATRTLKQHEAAHEQEWNESTRRQGEKYGEILHAAKRELEEQKKLLRRIPEEHVWEHHDRNKCTRTWSDAAKVLETLQPLVDLREPKQKADYWSDSVIEHIFTKLGLPAPMVRRPEPDLIAPSWKSLLRSQAKSLVRCLREAGGGPAVVSWTPTVVMPGRLPTEIDPGEWRVEQFNLQADALEEFVKRETGRVEEVPRTLDTDHLEALLSLKPSVCALVLSEQGRDHGVPLIPEVVEAIVNQILTLAERLPDQVDFCALLGKIAWECLRCEFAGVSGLTLGVRWNSRGGLSLCGVGTESRRDKDEAIAAFRRAMAFTLVLPTPTPPGTAAWVERHAAREARAINTHIKLVKRHRDW